MSDLQTSDSKASNDSDKTLSQSTQHGIPKETTDYQISKYQTRAVQALEEYINGMTEIARASYNRLPKYLREKELPPFDMLSPDDRAIIDHLNEVCQKRFNRLAKDIEKRYGFEVQQENDDEYQDSYFIVQTLPNGSVLNFDGRVFEIDDASLSKEDHPRFHEKAVN
jgi:hypothetical protein